LNDQPAGILDQMALLSDIYNAADAYYGSTDTARWAQSNDRAWELYAWARKIERTHGK
jgi:hypothetical protein